MNIELLPENTQPLYADLLDRCLYAALSAHGICFVSKIVTGVKYWYLQWTLGASKRQFYMGPDTEEVRRKIEAIKKLWESEKTDREARARMVAMLQIAGCRPVSPMIARLLEALEQAGIFTVGGIIVGSHAFAQYENMLGVRWDRAFIRTQDLDIANDFRIHVAIPNREIDLQKALHAAEKDILPIPALNPKAPSTSFRYRKKDFRIDVLTPMIGRPSNEPIPLKSIRAVATPVRFLDYLLEDIQPVIVIAKSGILINVPTPARFALHKLVISQRRPAAMQAKALKDIQQAGSLLGVLREFRPGDITIAAEAACQMPKKFKEELHAGARQLQSELREWVMRVV